MLSCTLKTKELNNFLSNIEVVRKKVLCTLRPNLQQKCLSRIPAGRDI